MQPYGHFTLEEREKLRQYRNEGKSMRQIGALLNRSPSSISREIRRNQNRDGSYNAWRGTCQYIVRRKRSRRRRRLETDEALMAWTKECLGKYWPPETIVAIWKKANPEAKLSHTTIYHAIQDGLLAGYAAKTHLRRRGKRSYVKGATTSIHPERWIDERDEEANQRRRIGDWEGDTVYGAVSKGYLLTCQDRRTRYFKAVPLPDKRKARVREAMVRMLAGYPVHSLTLDNGSEFAEFARMEQQLQAPVYFARPHSPWQRGSIENIHDILRFFYPKGTDFLTVKQNELDAVLQLMNNRPRKCLGWLSPSDLFFAKCCT